MTGAETSLLRAGLVEVPVARGVAAAPVGIPLGVAVTSGGVPVGVAVTIEVAVTIGEVLHVVARAAVARVESRIGIVAMRAVVIGTPHPGELAGMVLPAGQSIPSWTLRSRDMNLATT